MSAPVSVSETNWQAHLALTFSGREDKTVISHRQHHGPLVMQKPFYPEKEVCHAYILHPPGGVAGGDRLTIDVITKKLAHALITTPASNKFYRSEYEVSKARQSIDVESGAVLEWLPQDSIMFSGCKVDMQTKIHLEQGAKFIGWEIVCLGRPASDESFEQGYCNQKLEIWRGDKPLYIENAKLQGGGDILDAKWGMSGYTVTGLMLVSDADKEMLELARSCDEDTPCLSASSLKGELLVTRCLGHQGMETRQYFTRVWSALRPKLLKREASIPRIWFT